MKIRLLWFGITSLLFLVGVAMSATGHGGRATQIFNISLILLLVTMGTQLFSSIKTDDRPSEKNNIWMWFLVAGIFLFIFRPFWFNSFANLGNDSNLLSQSLLRNISFIPQSWESELGGVDFGHNQVVNMWMQPLWIFISAISKLGVSYPLLVKGLMVAQILIGSLGIYYLFKKLNIANWTIPIGTLFYFLNTYFLVNVDGGLIFLSFAYAGFPAGLYFILNLVENNSTRNLLVASFWLIVVSFFDIRVALLIMLSALLWVVVVRKYRSLLSIISLGVFLITAHLFWILPALKTGVSLPVAYTANGGVEQFSLFSSGHLLLLSQPHWYSNIFGDIQIPRWYFAGLPLLIFLALGFAKSTPKYKLLVALAFIGLLLMKGGQPYLWLYKNLPGFIFFRDPSKLSVLLTLAYTGLICLALEVVGQRFPKFKNLLLVGTSVYFVGLISPVYLNQTTGAFVQNPKEIDYTKFSQTISHKDFSRALWLPNKPPQGVVDLSPVWTEAGWLLAKRPFLSAIDGTYELYNYVRATESASLFDVTGIKYLLYPQSDQRKHILKPDEKEYYQWQYDWFKSQNWLKDISPFAGLGAFEVATVSGKFYEPQNWLWVVGPDDTYTQLAKLPNFRLANIGVTHLNNFPPGLIKPGGYLFFNKVGFLDLVLSQVERKNLISLYPFVSPTADGRKEWWGRGSGNFIFAKNYLKDQYGVDNNDYDLELGYAIAEGEKSLQINHNFSKGHLFTRILQSRAGGNLEFNINNNQITFTTISDDEVFVWKDLGVYSEISNIEIKSDGPINVVNTLVIVPESEYEQLVANAKAVVSKSKVILDLKNLTEITSKPSNINYSKLSQTEYIVEVQTAPTWIVFSESYDLRWQISAPQGSPIPAYDMLNAFWVEKPGSYRIFYSPQIWVGRGLGITAGIFLISAFVLLLRYKNGKI